MIAEFLTPALSSFVAELGDKSQFMIIALSAKYHRSVHVFLASMCAFVLTQVFAVTVGGLLGNYISTEYMLMLSGFLFLIFGMYALLTKEDTHVSLAHGAAFPVTFGLLFFAEMGDKTQIAAAVFATHFWWGWVLLGSIIGLGLSAVLAVLVGKVVKKICTQETIHVLSGFLFCILGIGMILYGLFSL